MCVVLVLQGATSFPCLTHFGGSRRVRCRIRKSEVEGKLYQKEAKRREEKKRQRQWAKERVRQEEKGGGRGEYRERGRGREARERMRTKEGRDLGRGGEEEESSVASVYHRTKSEFMPPLLLGRPTPSEETRGWSD